MKPCPKLRVLVVTMVLMAVAAPAFAAEPARGQEGMVVTVHPIATDAAVKVLKEGGNAVDAAVAAALVLGVVDGHNSGIGGGCFMLIRTADGQTIALDGREVAPAAATRDMFLRDGKADTRPSQTGPLASGIPGSLKVYEHAVRKFGQRDLSTLIEPAAAVAEAGFAIDRTYAQRLSATIDDIRQFPSTAAVLLKADGSPYREGEILRQPDLARTYRAIAVEGSGHFYGGAFAAAVETWMKAHGGIITARDFADYAMVIRQPLVTTYGQHTIIGFPPPSSGGVHVAQLLNMFEGYDLAELERQDPALRVHVMVEAMKLAFADRAYWLGDPAFTKVPAGLIDKDYAAQRRQQISLDRATRVEAQGTPADHQANTFPGSDKHTTHIVAADAAGNWVSLTTTVNTAFGSKVIIPDTGVIMNNQMDDFSLDPGTPNAFGLVGAEANAVAPGKRPLSSMSPTIVLGPDDQPVLALGAAGGPKIITQVVNVLVNHLALGHDLPRAMDLPRFHHQWSPDVLWIEKTAEGPLLDRLRALGHQLEVAEPTGATQAIIYADGEFSGVPEPRLEGKAAAPDAVE